jgi:hypothetical protein
MKPVSYAVCGVLANALSGCAGGHLSSDDIRAEMEADARKGSVVAQLCFAVVPDNQPLKDFVPMDVVKKGSIGGTVAERIGSTASGQPLFQKNTATQSLLKALVIPYRPNLWLVFEPPQNLSFEKWSNWEDVTYSTTYKQAYLLILDDKPIHKYTMDKKSVRARYRLRRYPDDSSFRSVPNLDIPSC